MSDFSSRSNFTEVLTTAVLKALREYVTDNPDSEFAASVLDQYRVRGAVSVKQRLAVEKMLTRAGYIDGQLPTSDGDWKTGMGIDAERLLVLYTDDPQAGHEQFKALCWKLLAWVHGKAEHCAHGLARTKAEVGMNDFLFGLCRSFLERLQVLEVVDAPKGSAKILRVTESGQLLFQPKPTQGPAEA